MEPLVAKAVYLLGYWVANFIIRAPYMRSHQRLPTRFNRKTRLDNFLFWAVSLGGFLLPLIYVFTPWLSFADYFVPLWLGLSGVVLLVCADVLFWRAHKDLGSNWSPTLEIRQGHQLITRGIYREVRHPMYASLWLLVISQAMILPNWIAGFSALIPYATLYFSRVRQEERMMLEEFGREYEVYLERTGRLFPKWR